MVVCRAYDWYYICGTDIYFTCMGRKKGCGHVVHAFSLPHRSICGRDTKVDRNILLTGLFMASGILETGVWQIARLLHAG